MESLKFYEETLRNLRQQAEDLTFSVRSLSRTLNVMRVRFKREDQVSRLNTLKFTIRQQLEIVRQRETTSRYSRNQEELASFLVKLAVGGVIKIASKRKTFPGYLLSNTDDKHQSFGEVFVCVGPKWVPDDVNVISISRLAREENRQEDAIMRDLRENGFLLFTESGFGLLIDRLITEVKQGQLVLPVNDKTLCKMMSSTNTILLTKKKK